MTFRVVAYVFLPFVLPMILGCATGPSSVNPVVADSVAQSDVPEPLILSGYVGVSDVVIVGMSNSVTDSNGVYSATVPYGWSGTLRPEKEGFTFEPPHRRYISINNSKSSQNFMARPRIHTLSGSIGIEGVKLMGLPGLPQTEGNGCYSVDLAYGWSGTVTPQKEGLVFAPESIYYDRITQDMLHEDYQTRPIQHTISGTVGLAEVHMSGLPGRIVTNEKGQYQAMVPHGWSGRVIPKRINTDFEPMYRDYKDVNSGYRLEDYSIKVLNATMDIDAEDYRDEVLTLYTVQPLPKTKEYLTISGQFIVQGESVEALTVEASNGGTTSLTDIDGRFELTIPYGWSGELSVRKPGLYVYPSTWHYTNITQNLRLRTREQTEEVDTVETENAPVDIESSIEEADSPDLTEEPQMDEPIQLAPHLISVTELAPDVYTELEQDLSVMTTLLEKTVYGASLVRSDRASRIRAIFLENDCALFTIPIDWPLFDLESIETTSRAVADTTEENLWEQTRQEILRSRRAEDVVVRLGHKKTLQFKQQLIEALGYASNIRHLGEDQWITLFVWSHRSSKRLVLRVQKEVVDQFARGQCTSEEFTEHVTSWMY